MRIYSGCLAICASTLTVAMFTCLTASAAPNDNTEFFAMSGLGPLHGIDIDSMEGFLCKTDSRILADDGGDVFCTFGGVAIDPVPGVKWADRVAVDHGGRVWAIRWDDEYNSGLLPGLFVEVAGELRHVDFLPALEPGDRVDSIAMTGIPDMTTVHGIPDIPLRTPVIISEAGRVFAYNIWGQGEDIETGDLVDVVPGWNEIFAPQEGASEGTVISWAPTAITHTRLGNVSFGWLLSTQAIPHMIVTHNKLVFEGQPYFPIFTWPAARLPVGDDPNLPELGQSSLGSRNGAHLWGTRFLWSREYWVNSYPDYSWVPPIYDPFDTEAFVTTGFIWHDSPGERYYYPTFGADAENWDNYQVYEPMPCWNSGCQVASNVSAPEFVQIPYSDYYSDGTQNFAKIIPLDDVTSIEGGGILREGGLRAAAISTNGRLNIMRSIRPTDEFDLKKFSIGTGILPENLDFAREIDPDGGLKIRKLRAGYAEIPTESVTTHELPLPRDDFALNVYVPLDAAGWVGDIQLSIDISAAGLDNIYLGNAGLTELTKGEWSTIYFSIPANVKEALMGDYPGVHFRTFVNTSSSGVEIGEFSVSGDYSSTPRAPHQTVRSDIRTNSMLDFEDSQVWAGVMSEDVGYSTSGVKAKRVSSSGWIEFLSPNFQTENLPSIGDRLAMNFYPPSPAPNPYWSGDVQAFVSCPTANLHNAWIDWTSLEGLFPNEYNTIEFNLPANVRSVLGVPGHSCSFRFTFNTVQGASTASFLIDEIGFVD